MKFLDVILTVGVDCLAAASLVTGDNNSHAAQLFDVSEREDNGNLYRRGSKDRQTPANPSPAIGDTSSNTGTPHSQLRGASPQRTRISPTRSSNLSPPHGRPVSQPSSSTSQRAPVAERGRKENNSQSPASPSPARSLFPSPPPRPDSQRTNLYVAMAGASKSIIPHSLGPFKGEPAPLTQIQIEQRAKREAKGARALANKRYAEAEHMSDTKRANSPTTKLAVSDSLDASRSAIRATRHSADEQHLTAVKLIGTSEHHTIDGRLESAARRQARVAQRQSHNLAFEAQHRARQKVENVIRQPVGHAQLVAIQDVALEQKNARNLADIYYRDHEDYRQTKSLVPGDSSSSDDEHELSDYPKTWAATRARRS